MTALIVVATIDAAIFGNTTANKDQNYGTAVTFQTGGGITALLARGIFLFDLSFLEAGTIINSAYISFFSASALNANASQLLEIPVADVGWVEGTKNGAIEVGSNCWNWYAYNTVAWSSGVGCPGGTFIANFNTPTPQYAEVQIVLGPAMVQAWVGPSGINPGVIAKAQTGTVSPRAMYTKDFSNALYRPKITMDIAYPVNLKPPTVWPHYRM